MSLLLFAPAAPALARRPLKGRGRSKVVACAASWQLSVHARLQETARSDRLLDDSFAQHLVGDEHTELAACDSEAVVARSFDAALLNAVREPELRQVVVLGWGGDTRAYRLPWPPSVRLFELAPFDAVAHAELAFARAGVRAAKGLLLRRVAAEDSLGWTERLLAAGFMPDRTSAWALQGLHTLSREALLEVMLEVGEAAAVGSSLVGEVLLQDAETGLGAMLAGAGIQLQSWAPLQEVGASLGRTLVPEEQPRALFSAAKTRVTGRQFEAMREELQRAEGDDIGEDGFADAP